MPKLLIPPVLIVALLGLGCDELPDPEKCENNGDCVKLRCDPGETPQCVDMIGPFLECGCVPDGGSDASARDTIEDILGFPVEDISLSEESAPVDVATPNSNGQIPASVPVDSIDAQTIGALAAFLNLAQLQRLKDWTFDRGAFSVGDRSSGAKSLALPAEMPAELLEGPYLFVWQTMQGPIPEADPVQRFQYAFVADHDRQVLNNFRGQEPFEGDYFDNTDLWFALEYDPQNGWRLEVTDALNGDLTSVPSAATGILSGAVQMFVIPVSEFKGSSTIAARWTAFAHEGDFGQEGGPWSGDTTPPVGAALKQIPLTTD